MRPRLPDHPPARKGHGRHSGHGNHLPRWQRRALYGVGAALLASGLLWLALHYTVGAGADALPHPLEAWAMRLHGAAAFGALFMLGVIAGAHLPRGWRMSAHGRPKREFRRAQPDGGPVRARRRWAAQRPVGIALCVLSAVLVASAYALYYAVPERWHEPVGWAHAGLGVALAGLLAVHARRR